MKSILIILIGMLMLPGTNAQYKLVKKWETDTILKVPESVLLDVKNQLLYVSNIDGKEPWAKDGKGSIGKITLTGRIIATDWVTGLNAPKGMGLYHDKLYVADVDKIVVIDTLKGQIIQEIPIADSKHLNDITIDENGAIYVSDSETKKVHKIENATSSTILEKLEGPNGLLMFQKVLYVLDNGKMYRMEDGNKLTLITDGLEGGTDGIENLAGNDFIISCWYGSIWHVKNDGTKQLLLDTHLQKINTADIALDAKNKMLYVPTFWKNSVVAYQIIEQ